METTVLERQETQIQATTPDQLLALAVTNDVDLEKLEKLMALKERWDAQQAKKAFFAALGDFQALAPELRKGKQVQFETKTGGRTEYSYAPLSDIARQIKQTLKDCGLSYRWEIEDEKDTIRVSCIITHVDGHAEKTTLSGSPDVTGSKNPIQARGSAIEYLRRYSLIAALGITTADSDIDGRMPELDIDKLHQSYMELYEDIVAKDEAFRTPGHPDNWAADRTPELYVKAIGKARQLLAQLTLKK